MTVRVVVTGLGIVSPVGIGKDNFARALATGQSGIEVIKAFDASAYTTCIAGEVKNFAGEDYNLPLSVTSMGRFAQFAAVATQEALADAQLEVVAGKNNWGISLGTSRGGALELVEAYEKWRNNPSDNFNPKFMSQYFSDSAAINLAGILGMGGPLHTVGTACASGTMAIGSALRYLQRGEAEVMITGGSEASISPLFFAGACTTRAMSTLNENPAGACRPFDAQRDGYVMGEGAGMVIMETLEHAQRRGAPIYAEVCSCGLSCDAYHVTAPDPEGAGLARAMQQALQESGLKPQEVEYINAHGTGTRLNDSCETNAIKRVFQESAYNMYVSSTKSVTGHMMGAAGAVEFIASLLALERGFIPPTINYAHPDPECDLNYVPNKAIKKDVNVAMSNSAGFGGHNASLIMKKI